jgi:putative ABC transport system permease protein
MVGRVSTPGEWAWLRWAGVPWQQRSLAAALIAAIAAPVMLVVSVDLWRASAEDAIAARVVGAADADELARNGVDIEVEAVFGADTVTNADRELRSRLAAIELMAEPDLTLYTLPGLIAIGPPVRTVGPGGRLFARPGALESIEIVEEADATNGGVWISDDFAERHDIGLGDGVAFEAGAIADEEWNDLVQGGGSTSIFPIVGIYEHLWSEDGDEPKGVWADVPPEILPTYVPAFGGPSSELVITEVDTLLDSGLTGVARWRAPLSTIPDTYDGLHALRREIRSFESALVGTRGLGNAMAAVATSAARRPILTTDLYETTAELDRSVVQLAQPLDSARTVGGIVGLVAALAAGVFFVDRRRAEFRLLAGEGGGIASMTVRVGGQLVLPAVCGAAIGIALGIAGTRLFGPGEPVGLADVRWTSALAAAAAALALASLSAGMRGARTLLPTDRGLARSIGLAIGGALMIATGAVWYQARVGRVATGSVDLVVATLPVLTALASITVVLLVGSWLLGLLGRATGDRAPPEVFLAARRLAAGSSGIRMTAGALGLGVGLLVFSIALRSTLERTVDVKLATEIGGATAVDLIDELPIGFDAPAPSTVVRTFDSVVTPGAGRVRVIAVDPVDFADAVEWPAEFGDDPAAVLSILAGADGSADATGQNGGRVAAVAVIGEPTPQEAAIGVGTAFPYRIVARVGSFPGAGQRDLSLLVIGDEFDRAAFERAGYDSVESALDDGFELPTDRFRQRLISRADPGELTSALDAAGVRWRNVTSRDERSREAGLAASRWAFGFLGVLGVVAATAALAALVLYLAARRRSRALAGVMTHAMGLSPARTALVTALETMTIAALAIVAGFVGATLSVDRLLPRFDPAPQLPPHVSVFTPWGVPLAIAALGLAALGGVIWAVERRAARRPAGQVLRELG